MCMTRACQFITVHVMLLMLSGVCNVVSCLFLCVLCLFFISAVHHVGVFYQDFMIVSARAVYIDSVAAL